MVSFNPHRLTNTCPEPPPEGVLIELARKKASLSLRAASERAGISYTTWRATAGGFTRPAAGKYLPCRGTARNLAKMAKAVGVTAEQLEAAGREDAAAKLRAPAPEPAPSPGLPVMGFHKVESYVWHGPGSKQERMAMIAAYRAVRYRQWKTWMEAQDGSPAGQQALDGDLMENGAVLLEALP